MKNLGEVDIKGIDATGSLSLQPWDKIRINLSGNYTYQRALDVTPPDPNTYESTYGKVFGRVGDNFICHFVIIGVNGYWQIG